MLSMPLPSFNEQRSAGFESFVAGLRPVFHRADQSLRFRAYLRGLLEPSDRKNVETIAASASRHMMLESDLAQALQHFVSQSPWSCERLIGALLEQSRNLRKDPEAIWVIHDAAFAKKGQHSVGVYRQLARDQQKKINCQVAVLVTQVGPKGFFPLAARLYLPGPWLRENQPIVEKSIPEEHRLHCTKGEIALGLIESLRSTGERTCPIALTGGYSDDFELQTKLKNQGISLPNQVEDRLQESSKAVNWLKNELGLDHFEGRSWLGWHHHVSLVFTAYYFLARKHLG
jgi:SRSO17 transposase